MLSEFDLIVLLRVALAATLGFLVGLERMAAGAPIRARTLSLATMTTALVMAVSVETYGVESSRVVQGLVTGVGFLGAGIILHSAAGEVQGLTTAATVWAMGAVGIVIGSGHELLAILMTVLIGAFITLSDSPLIARAIRWWAARKAGRGTDHDGPRPQKS
jgi:putative Mg2+ transporter-C (MgtC) family protein